MDNDLLNVQALKGQLGKIPFWEWCSKIIALLESVITRIEALEKKPKV